MKSGNYKQLSLIKSAGMTSLSSISVFQRYIHFIRRVLDGNKGAQQTDLLPTEWLHSSVGSPPLAQLVEHRAAMREVVSSTSAGPTLRVLT